MLFTASKKIMLLGNLAEDIFIFIFKKSKKLSSNAVCNVLYK